jgi:hypothetical protein
MERLFIYVHEVQAGDRLMGDSKKGLPVERVAQTGNFVTLFFANGTHARMHRSYRAIVTRGD